MTTPTAADVLRRARELIADERNWCQGWFTRRSGRRVQRCAVQALRDAVPQRGKVYLRAFRLLEDAIPPDVYALLNTVPRYQDNSTHAEVLALFDRAIAAAEAQS